MKFRDLFIFKIFLLAFLFFGWQNLYAEPLVPKNNKSSTAKRLDLTITPLQLYSADLQHKTAMSVPAETENNLLVFESKKPQPKVQLNGNVLMTQELEADKLNSFDGAGIVLKVIH